MIQNWKVRGYYRNKPRNENTAKLGYRKHRVLSRIIRRSHIKPITRIYQEFEITSGCVVSINAVHKKSHLLLLRGCAATQEPSVTMSNSVARLKWCKSHRYWTIDRRYWE